MCLSQKRLPGRAARKQEEAFSVRTATPRELRTPPFYGSQKFSGIIPSFLKRRPRNAQLFRYFPHGETSTCQGVDLPCPRGRKQLRPTTDCTYHSLLRMRRHRSGTPEVSTPIASARAPTGADEGPRPCGRPGGMGECSAGGIAARIAGWITHRLQGGSLWKRLGGRSGVCTAIRYAVGTRIMPSPSSH